MRKTAILLAGLAIAAMAQNSKWVSLDSGQRLQYTADSRGNRIMDFSHAGYKGGGVRLPAIKAARTLNPAAGDNTAAIKAALDAVAGLPLDADGFRGAVVLGPGIYEVAGTLQIAASGVVLRGAGSGDGGTTLKMTGPPHRLFDVHGAGSWQVEGTPAAITDRYVPSGADSFRVDSAAGFRKGDTVLIRRPVTEAWIHFMGMDTLVRDGKPQTWIKAGTTISTDRIIQSISGDTITVDVPLSDSLDSQYLNPPGATIVKYTFSGRIAQVGIESLHVLAPGDDKPIDQGQYTLLRMNAVSDAWMRDVIVQETQNGITISPTSRRITLERVRIRHSIPHTSAAAPADIAISGTQVLIDRCSVSGKGTWPIVTQNGVTGPNVVLHFESDEAGVSPHQRWASGLLVDSSEFRNNTDKRPGVAFSNRSYAGSGHGWTIGWGVAWNVKSDYFLIQQPPGTMNWCIGCTSRPSTVAWDSKPIPPAEVPSAIWESPGKPVLPASLYLQQLRDRLGAAALANIGYEPEPAVAEDWPRFRGPNGTGIADGHPLPNQIRPGEEIWQMAVPPGHSSPIVASGHLYLTAADGDKLLTIALDARTGKELWRRQPPRDRKEHLDNRNSPASPSPAVDGERVVVFFPDFGLLAYDHAGRELWTARLGPFDNSYGMGASPVLVDGKVVLVCDQSRDSFIAAFDAANGKLAWKRARPHAVSGHSTPSVFRSGSTTLILAPASFRMDAYDAETGEPVWWLDRLPSEMKSVPVIAGDTVFVSGYNLAENEPGRQIQLPPFKDVLEKHDKNSDGFLARDESPDEMTRRYFPYLDLDHNGKLDEREWKVFAAAFNAENSLQAIRLNGNVKGDVTASNVIWKYHRSIPQLPSVVAYRGDVYMISDNGVLTILEAATGTLRKQFRLNNAAGSYFASPVAGDGKLIFVSHDGVVTVLRAGGEYDVLSKAEFNDVAFATPAIVDGRVYIRTAGRLYCFVTK